MRILQFSFFTIFFLLFVIGCYINQSSNDESYQCILQPSGKKIGFNIDSNTIAESRSLFSFATTGDTQYLAYLNEYTNTILFYNVKTQMLEHRIEFTKEGPNSTGRIFGFRVLNKDSIFVSTFNGNTIYLVNSKGKILRNISYKKSSKNEPLVFSESWSFFYSPMIYKDKKLYLTQTPIFSDKICAEIDLSTDSIKLLPMYHPDFNKLDLEKNIFCRDFDGVNFLYSFLYKPNIYITQDHITFYEKLASSKLINKITLKTFQNRPSFEEGTKAFIETPHYRSIVYDPYRSVYYRFAYPGVEISKKDNLKILAKYFKNFSIIILDKDFIKIGEYFTPDNIYNIKMFFISKEGLYLSSNHILNPDYDENKVSFELFKLIKK